MSATITDNITFERIERDCDYNKREREQEAKPQLIYDYKVEIDGEYRATLKKNATGKGYEIYDADSRPIHTADDKREGWHPRHIGSKVERKADFFRFVHDLLASNRIPTIAEMATMREQEASRAVEIARQARKNVIDRVAERHGPELLAALKALLAVVDKQEWGKPWPGRPHAEADAAMAVIAKAEDPGEHFDSLVQSETWALERH